MKITLAIIGISIIVAIIALEVNDLFLIITAIGMCTVSILLSINIIVTLTKEMIKEKKND